MKKAVIKLIKDLKILWTSLGILILIAAFFLFQTEKPTSFKGMFRVAENYEKQGKLSRALEQYMKTARIYPKSYEIHMKLGNLFLQVKETERAKIEYYRAISLKNIAKYDAYFAMANIYFNEGNYNFAQEILMDVKDIPDKEVVEQLGDFYYKWGRRSSGTDLFESVRKYKEAYEFYKKSGSQKAAFARNAVDKAYGKISDKLIAENKLDNAVKILNLSIEFNNSPFAHYKLARIYENKDIDLALKEYDIAFRYKSVYSLDSNGYANLLVKKGDILDAKGKKTEAEYYYNKAKRFGPKLNIFQLRDKQILLILLAARYNEDTEKDIITPGISFRIMNVSKSEIPNLRAKVVFYDNDKQHSEEIISLADTTSPMQPDAITDKINVFSNAPMSQVFSTHNIKVQIYISQSIPDKWKLYRNVYLRGPQGAGIKLK